ncbi:MAG: peptidase fungalysin, partial [Frankiales bacterium]|nr:peptidase fungalysin [Frankiales bacterium]
QEEAGSASKDVKTACRSPCPRSRLPEVCPLRRRPQLLLTTGLLSVSALSAGLLPSASAAPTLSSHLLRPAVGPDAGGFPGAEVAVGDRDARGPVLAPQAAALRAVADLGSGTEVSWNQYGTPRTLVRSGGWLAQGLAGTPAQAARAFLAARPGLLGLSAADVAGLTLVSSTPLSGSPAHAVLFRQSTGGIPLTEDGLVTVGVRDGGVASVTSSAVPASVLGTLSSRTPRLSALQGVLAAAKDAGLTTLSLDDLSLTSKVDSAGFTQVLAKGLAQVQRARLRALPTTDRGARLVWETAVQDVAGGRATAVASFVDAVTGDVLLRRDAVDTLAAGTRSTAGMRSVGMTAQAAPSGGTITGTYTATACSAPVPLTVPAGTRTLAVVAAVAVPANDITIKINKNGSVATVGDNATSPEVATLTLEAPSTASDTFSAQVCPFDANQLGPLTFVGSYATTDQAAGSLSALPSLPGDLTGQSGVQGPALFDYFPSNPTLPVAGKASPDDRKTVCSGSPSQTSSKDLKACDIFTYNDTSPLPYDADGITGLPTFTTLGNNAVTTNAQLSTSLTPGPPTVSPLSPTRDYAPAFTDSWHTSNCDPASLVDPTRRGDVDASIVNLFTGHNRIHDFAYRLGLTEERGAMQTSNFGKPGAQADPELGNAQNAAITQSIITAAEPATTPAGGLPVTGRDNANQITLQDGVPGITNQYLFQSLLGFYAPCADGDLDATIFLHEYTHAISNRLVGGPDTGLSGHQGGSMGESWSDLVAVEYLQAFGLAGKRGEDPYALGAYATGNRTEGIRDYNLRPSKNPLTYGEIGFDSTGPEVHADGEIWNAIQMTVREALMKKYDARFPSSDATLQAACALGRTTTGAVAPTFDGCPGNRRWVTYLFDGMILQASGTPSMVDIKNTMLAADTLRKSGDQAVLGSAFASRGLGAKSASKTTEDTDPTPSFASPVASANQATTFALVDAVTGKPVKGKVFVGTYSARTTPIATTLGGKNAGPTTALVAGTHKLVVAAAGYGIQRFSLTAKAGQKVTQKLTLAQNLASPTRGAKVSAPGAVRAKDVIDEDEGTNLGFDGAEATTKVAGRSVVVDLAGSGASTVRSIAVSALGRPAKADDAADVQGRLIGLRAFDLQASTDGGKTYTTVYKSPSDYFPVLAPRATAPTTNLRTVTLPKAVKADHLKLVVRTNQCTGQTAFQGDKDADPLNDADCLASDNAYRVNITELQAFGTAPKAVAGGTSTGGTTASGGTAAGVGSLPTTGSNGPLTALGLGLAAAAAVAVRRRRALTV